MDRRKFIGTCTCCALASAGAVFLNNNNLNANSNSMQNKINHIEVHIAEHCNLSCKYCSHFSCIAQKEFYNLDKFNQDMKQMSSVLNKQLADLQLLGGEPLLNPQINEYVKISRKYFPKTRIGITTNATLLDSMNEDFWKTLDENDVKILPSVYPIKINWASILNKAKKYNVKIYGDYKTEEKLTLNNIDKFCKKVFRKTKLNKNGNGGIDNSNCDLRLKCNSMYDGKLYPCATIAYIRHLNKKFNTDFKLTEKDYIDLYNVKDISEVKNFINSNHQFPFCRYCISDAGEVKWENCLNHDISEWT